MRFKVDENLPLEVSIKLRSVGCDALTIHDQQMVGDSDPRVAEICVSEKRTLLTLDLDFADIRTYPPGDHCGIIVLRPKNHSKPAVLRLVQQIIPFFDEEPLSKHLWIVDETGLRIRAG